LQIGDATRAAGILASEVVFPGTGGGLYLYSSNGPVGTKMSGTLNQLTKFSATSADNATDAEAYPDVVVDRGLLPDDIGGLTINNINVQGGLLVIPAVLGGPITGNVTIAADAEAGTHGVLQVASGNLLGALASDGSTTYTGSLSLATGALLDFDPVAEEAESHTLRLTGTVNFAGDWQIGDKPVNLVFAPGNYVSQTFAGRVLGGGGFNVEVLTGAGVSSRFTFAGAESYTFPTEFYVDYSGAKYAADGNFLVFNKTGGSRIESPILHFHTDVVSGGGLGIVVRGNNQFSSNALLSFTGTGGSRAWFAVNGTTQTIGGLESGAYSLEYSAASTANGSGGIENIGQDFQRNNAVGTLILNVAGEAVTRTFNGAVRDGGDGTLRLNLVKEGEGTQQLGGQISLGGSIEVRRGVLEFFGIAGGAEAKFAPRVAISGGALLKISGVLPITLGGSLVLSGGEVLINTKEPVVAAGLQIGAAISGFGNVHIAHEGLPVTLTAAATVALDKGARVEVASGRVVNAANWAANAGTLVLGSSATLDLRGSSVTLGALDGAGRVFSSTYDAAGVAAGGNMLVVGVGGDSSDPAIVFSGDISAGGTADGSVETTAANSTLGAVTLRKAGGGRQVLSGFTAAGLLEIQNGAVQIGDGAVNGRLVTPVVQSVGILDLRTAPGTAQSAVFAVQGSGQLVKSGAGVATIFGRNQHTGLTIVQQGTLRLGATELPADLSLMPFGDDTAVGAYTVSGQTYASNAGYRGFLNALLSRTGGTNFNFVGDALVPTVENPTPTYTNPGALPAQQQAHAGISGDRIAYLLGDAVRTGYGTPALLDARIATVAGLATPSAMLINIGVNDIIAGDTAAIAAGRMERLIEKITTGAPGTTVFLATLIPVDNLALNAAKIAEFNTWLRDVFAPAQIAAGKKVVLVDFEAGGAFPAGTLPDRLHLNNTGYAYASAAWYEALVSALGGDVSRALPVTGVVEVAPGAVFDVNNKDATVGGIAGAGTVSLGAAGLRAGQLTINIGEGDSRDFSGVLTGNGGINKDGLGTLTLGPGGVFDYTGRTAVSAGRLVLAGQPSATSRVEVAGGAVLDTGALTVRIAGTGVSRAGRSGGTTVDGGFDIAGSIEFADGHSLDVGAPGVAAQLDISGSLVFSSGSMLRVDVSSAEHDLITIGGSIAFDSASKISPVLIPGGVLVDADITLATLAAPYNGPLSLDDYGISGDPNIISFLRTTSDKKEIYLHVTSGGPRYLWTATGDAGTWNTTAANWRNDDASLDGQAFPTPAAADSDEPNLCRAVFTGAGAGRVVLAERLEPVLLTIEGGNYVFENTSGFLAERTGIVVEGGATLAIRGSVVSALNRFERRLFVSDGAVLSVEGGATLLANDGQPSLLGSGSGASAIELGGGASLVFNGDVGNITQTTRSFSLNTGGATLAVEGAAVHFNSGVPVLLRGTEDITLTLAGGGLGTLALMLADSDDAALSLVKGGAGTWHLSGANSYTGGTRLASGKLAVNASGALGTGVLDFAAGVLTNDSPTGVGVSATLGNAIVLGAAGLEINAGSGATFTLAGAVSSAGGFVKTGAGTLALGAANPGLSGVVSINSGVLRAGHSLALGAATATLASAAFLEVGTASILVHSLAGSGTVRAQNGTAPATLIFENAVAEAFAGNLVNGTNSALNLTKAGAGVLTLTGANTFTGAVNINAGTLRLGGATALAATGGEITVASGATLDIAGRAFGGRAATLAGTGAGGAGALLDSVGGGVAPALAIPVSATIRNATVSIETAGGTALTALSGAGVLTLAPAGGGSGGGVFTLSSAGASSVAALVAAPGATLRLTASEALAGTTALTLDAGGTLQLGGGVVQTLGAVAGAGSIGSVGAGGVLQLAVPVATATAFAGTIDGAASLSLVGGGTLTLSNAASTTTGAIRATGSTLRLAAALRLDASADVLGAPESAVFLEDATLESAAAVDAQTARAFTLAGAQTTLVASGAGGFQFLPGSALNFADATAAHALVLAGNGTGANRLDAPLADTPGGALTLRKTGSSTWFLGETGTYSGGVEIAQGVLALGVDDALPTAGAVVLGGATSSGTLRLNGFAQTLASLSVSADAAGAAIAENRVINGVAAEGVLTLNTAAGAAVFTGSLGAAGSALDNNFSFVKTGAGRLVLSGPALYTGATAVQAGVLAFAGAARPASPAISVFAGALLDVSALPGGALTLVSGQSLTAGGVVPGEPSVQGSVVLNGGSIAANEIAVGAHSVAGTNFVISGDLRVSSPSGATIALSESAATGNSVYQIGGDLDLSARVMLTPALLSGSLSLTPYTLFEYAGSLNGFVENLRVDNDALDPRYRFEIFKDPAANRVLLAVSSTSGGPEALRWRGNESNVWSATVRNFVRDGATPSVYFPEDAALFDNTAAQFDIEIDRGVLIGRVTFNNDEAHPYTVSGGRISGDGLLVKSGAGALTLLTPNSYLGTLKEDGASREEATVLAGGTLWLGDDEAIGTGAVRIYTATLGTTAGAARTLANEIHIAPGSAASFDSNGGSLTLSGALTGAENTRLVKAGAGTLALTGGTAGFAGGVEVARGALLVDTADFSRSALTLTGAEAVLAVSGGVTQFAELRGVAGSSVTGAGVLEVGAGGGSFTFGGALAGGVGLVKKGAGTLTLSGDNSGHTGAVLVSAGRLQFGDGSTGVVSAGVLTVEAGARVAFFPPDIPGGSALVANISGAGVLEKFGTGALRLESSLENFTGTLLVADGAFVVTDAGDLGDAVSIHVDSTLRFEKTGTYVIPNNITGLGSVVKSGGAGATAVWLGTGNAQLDIDSGTFSYGDGVTVFAQEQLGPTFVAEGTALVLAPAAGGSLVLGDLGAAAGGNITKTGGGTATLTGALPAAGALFINEGVLETGGASATAVESGADIRVEPGATLRVARAGETRFTGALVSGGSLEVASGNAVLLGAGNLVTGPVAIAAGGSLQIGDALHASGLGSAVVSVNVGAGAALRFNNTGTPTTGANLLVRGAGVVEHNGSGTTAFDSRAIGFSGTFLASDGVFVFDAQALPDGDGAVFDATGAGTLRVESEGPASGFAPNFGTGDGTILLAAKAGTSAAYSFNNTADTASFPRGAVAVGDRTTLRLVRATYGRTAVAELTAREVVVRAGGTLAGNGTLDGGLRVENGGTLKPGDSPGRIDVRGDYVSDGLLAVDVIGTDVGQYSSVHYTGTATILPAATVVLRLAEADYAALAKGSEFKVLVDDETATGSADLEGNFTPSQISVQITSDGGATWHTASDVVRSYNKGDGALTLGLSFPALDLHKGLGDFARGVDDAWLSGDAVLVGVASALMGSGAQAVQNASPLGLASMTAMTINMAHEDTAGLRSRTESFWLDKAVAKAAKAAATPAAAPVWEESLGLRTWAQASGNFEQNGTGNSDPTYDFTTYGIFAGLDKTIGDSLVAGIAAGFHSGRADIAAGGGKVKQDNVRLNLYGSAKVASISDTGIFVDASVSAGRSTYDVRQQTLLGTATAKPDGNDFGAALTVSAIVTSSLAGKSLWFTPRAGLEYVYSDVDDFTETGSAAALAVGGFDQDSLRFKIGTGAVWEAYRDTTFSVRVSLDLEYALEVFDPDAEIDVRFAAARSGAGGGTRSYRVSSAALADNSVLIGPGVEIGLGPRASLQFSYRFETDLANQTGHHLNAAFRVRF
jgi:autotransporter-associated beta strand protein